MAWIDALGRTLAGDTAWLITPTYLFPSFHYRAPPLTARLREEIGLPPVPPRTEAQKAAAHLRYVKKVFATQPTAKIAARLARRLGIAQTAEAWPTALLTITQTPAAYARTNRPKPIRPPAAPPATPPPTPPPPAAPPPPRAAGPP